MNDTERKDDLREAWQAEWEPALAAWSRFTQLSPPRFCTTRSEERDQGLETSFAMIRLNDQAVVISLRQVAEQGLQALARPILAHEIGHHVYAPANLDDDARLLARMRHALPSREGYAGFVANLYTDLLINDRLQRSAGLDMAAVYRKLGTESSDKLWALYLLVYETLWSLPNNSLVVWPEDSRLRGDAMLGARLIRAYAKDWLAGAGRFAALWLPYILEMPANQRVPVWQDTQSAGEGEDIPDGLAEIDDDEIEGAIHPADDPELSGVEEPANHPKSTTRVKVGGKKNHYRDPHEYVNLMQALGVKVDPNLLVMKYYRELALPHLVPFPARLLRQAADPVPEGLDPWDVGSPVSRVDWTATLVASPVVIPGLTTFERVEGTSEGGEPERKPLDLYVGIDCSGSMGNPAVHVSYPVLAVAVVGLSALRSGARVMACLSGEPGEFSQTEGFVRSESEVLRILTGYHGTGYAFGIERLRAAFLQGPARERPTHILVVSDSDLFHMLKEVRDAWDVAAQAIGQAGGGATAVLKMTANEYGKDVARLEGLGWTVHRVRTKEDLVVFARAFARARYGGNGVAP